jgi:hypothetical protein
VVLKPVRGITALTRAERGLCLACVGLPDLMPAASLTLRGCIARTC